MVAVSPGRFSPGRRLAFQKTQQLLTPYLGTSRLDQERTPPSRTDQGVDFPQQIVRQQNVGAFG
jgi:hypothetical protein